MSVRLAVTAGDPRGIGPEIINKALADPRIGARSDLVVIGPRGCGVDVDESIGSWNASGDMATAGRLSRSIAPGAPTRRQMRSTVSGP